MGLSPTVRVPGASALNPGEELRVGPVVLLIETIEAEDAELAFSPSSDPEPLSGLPSGETTAIDEESQEGAAGWQSYILQ